MQALTLMLQSVALTCAAVPPIRPKASRLISIILFMTSPPFPRSPHRQFGSTPGRSACCGGVTPDWRVLAWLRYYSQIHLSPVAHGTKQVTVVAWDRGFTVTLVSIRRIGESYGRCQNTPAGG